jgi:hypothetical protein
MKRTTSILIKCTAFQKKISKLIKNNIPFFLIPDIAEVYSEQGWQFPRTLKAYEY